MNNFVVKDFNNNKGLFSEVFFDKNQVLFKFDGKKLIINDAKDADEKFLQIGTKLYLDLNNHFSLFANHSCNANCFIKIYVNTAFLLSSRPINIGDELVFDFSLTSTENINEWSMKCNCDPFDCRKIISGFRTIPETKRNKLISAGMVPNYVLADI